MKAVAAADDLTYALTHGGQVVCLQPHGRVSTLFVGLTWPFNVNAVWRDVRPMTHSWDRDQTS